MLKKRDLYLKCTWIPNRVTLTTRKTQSQLKRNLPKIILHDSANKYNTKSNTLRIPLLQLAQERELKSPIVLMKMISRISGLCTNILDKFFRSGNEIFFIT